MSELHYDHPLPVGTILETANGQLHKVVVDWSLSEIGAALYTVYTIESAAEQPVIQNELDFEYMVGDNEYPKWEVKYDPREDTDD